MSQEPATPVSAAAGEEERMRSARTLTTVVYALQAAGLMVAGIPFLAAVIVNYLKLADVQGTWLESHFRWQIRTFWFGLLWGALGAVTLIVLIGWPILVANTVWVIYRIVKGWVRLADGQAMYTEP